MYNDWFRPFGVEYELELAIPAPMAHANLHLRPGGRRDFTERDRLVLDLLNPHLARLRDSAEAGRRSAAEVDPVQRTAREREVLSWVARGKTNPQIAELLWLSPATVRKHLENVYGKLGVSTRTAAVARFFSLDAEDGDAAATPR